MRKRVGLPRPALSSLEGFRAKERARRGLLLVGGLLLTSCSGNCTGSAQLPGGAGGKVTQRASTAATAPSSGEPRLVSILQLISEPERFGGTKVQVVGFVSLEFEGTAVYLHREDFAESLTANGIWLDLSDDRERSRRKEGYSIVEGIFNPDHKGHMALFSGSIEHIERLAPMPNLQRTRPVLPTPPGGGSSAPNMAPVR